MNPSLSIRSLPLVLATFVAACSGGSNRAPPPLASIPLPSGSALRPWNPGNPTRAAPSVLASGPGGSAFVSLTNLDDSFTPGGPGMLVRIQPETGAVTVILLGGADDHACTNSGVVRNDGDRLLAVCAGSFSAQDPGGRAVIEVDPSTNAPIRKSAPPAGFQPQVCIELFRQHHGCSPHAYSVGPNEGICGRHCESSRYTAPTGGTNLPVNADPQARVAAPTATRTGAPAPRFPGGSDPG